MPRVVFDTVVFVRSWINPHGPWGRLVFDHHASYELIVSPEIVREYLDVLQRPEITRKFRRVAELDVRRVIGLFEDATTVEPGGVPPVSRDPKDDKFLAAVRAADADYLVSQDDDLLDLGHHGRMRIVTARQFLDALNEAQR